MSNTLGGNMLLIKSSWNEGETFRLLPLTADCPYVECIFDPATKVFVVISKIVKKRKLGQFMNTGKDN